MLRRLLLLGAVLFVSMAGCKTSPPSSSQANESVFHFTPAPPMPKPITQPMETTGLSAGLGGGNTPYAQTFTASADGYLSEVQFAPQVQTSSKGDLTLDIWPTEKGLPVLDESRSLAREKIAASEMPTAGRMEGDLIRLDISRFNVPVKKGDMLALVVRPQSTAVMQYLVVTGDTYTGGDLYSFREGRWKAVRDNGTDFQFRVYADTAPAPATLPTTSPTTRSTISAFHPARGVIIAEAVPVPRAQRAFVTPHTAAGKWQISAVTFEHEGRWMLELAIFNGTNSFPMSQSALGSISVTRDGEERGWVVTPSQPAYGWSPPNQGIQMPPVAPGDGYIRQFVLWNKPEPLRPGTYRVTVVYGFGPQMETKQTTFVVPEGTHKKPAK
jgi:hypothetical protein